MPRQQTRFFTRIGLWFGSFVVAVTLFSLLCCLSSLSLDPFRGILLFTAFLALPVCFLNLPFAVALRNADSWRMWAILVCGALSGPVFLLALGVIMQLRGGNVHLIWQGDRGLDIGIVPSIPFADGLGLLTAGLYVLGLKAIQRRSTST